MHLDLPSTQEDQERYLREHNAANFIASVHKAKEVDGPVLLTLRAFNQEPEVLYVALDYANDLGVTVTLTPLAD
jgi:hypothetical protein